MVKIYFVSYNNFTLLVLSNMLSIINSYNIYSVYITRVLFFSYSYILRMKYILCFLHKISEKKNIIFLNYTAYAHKKECNIIKKNILFILIYTYILNIYHTLWVVLSYQYESFTF